MGGRVQTVKNESEKTIELTHPPISFARHFERSEKSKAKP
jgi:hypothetical protein